MPTNYLSGFCTCVKDEPVLAVVFTRAKPIRKILEKHRAKFRVERLAPTGPCVTVDDVKSFAGGQTQPMGLQDGSVSLLLKCRKNRVGETADGLFLFAYRERQQILDKVAGTR